MSAPIEIHQGPTTEKMSAIYRRVLADRDTCNQSLLKPNSEMHACMLRGKAKALTDVLCLIHDKYPEHVEEGLWEDTKAQGKPIRLKKAVARRMRTENNAPPLG